MRYVFCKSHKVDRLLMLQFENLFEKAILMCPMVVPLRYTKEQGFQYGDYIKDRQGINMIKSVFLDCSI